MRLGVVIADDSRLLSGSFVDDIAGRCSRDTCGMNWLFSDLLCTDSVILSAIPPFFDACFNAQAADRIDVQYDSRIDTASS